MKPSKIHFLMVSKGKCLSVLTAFALGIIAYLGLKGKMPPAPVQLISIFVVTMVFWITEVIPSHYTAVAAVFALVFTNTVSFSIVTQGFTNKAALLLFSGTLLAQGVGNVGLDKRVSFYLIKIIGHNPLRMIIGITLSSFFLTLLIPSGVSRILLLVPIALNLIRNFDPSPERRISDFSRAIMLALLYQSSISALAVLTSVQTNILGAGIIQQITGFEVNWSLWFLAMFPITFFSLIICVFIILFRYPLSPSSLSSFTPKEEPPPNLSSKEKVVLFFLLLAIIFWATDFLHHIHPGIVASLFVLPFFFPPWKILGFSDLTLKFPWYVIILLMAILSLSQAVADTEVSKYLSPLFMTLGKNLVDKPFLFTLYLSALIVFLHLGISTHVALTPFIPLIMLLGEPYHISPIYLGLLASGVARAGFLLPVQSGMGILLLQYKCFTTKDMLLTGSLLTIAYCLIFSFFALYWWPYLGINYFY